MKSGEKFPVHVSVGPQSFEIKGPSFLACSPRVVEVSRKGMMLDFKGGACKVAVKGATVVLLDGAGLASFDGTKLEMFFNGEDTLSLTASRK